MADTDQTQNQADASGGGTEDTAAATNYVDTGGPGDDTSVSGGLGGIDAGSPGGMGGVHGGGGTGGRPPGGISPVQIEQATQGDADEADQA